MRNKVKVQIMVLGAFDSGNNPLLSFWSGKNPGKKTLSNHLSCLFSMIIFKGGSSNHYLILSFLPKSYLVFLVALRSGYLLHLSSNTQLLQPYVRIGRYMHIFTSLPTSVCPIMVLLCYWFCLLPVLKLWL